MPWGHYHGILRASLYRSNRQNQFLSGVETPSAEEPHETNGAHLP